jgi:prepilin-type N-terminal cleavage/methylation domain-containing protein
LAILLKRPIADENMMNIDYSRKNPGGFTVIEIIAVLLIIAILGVVAISRITSPNYYKAASEAEILKANIRYAHFRALSDADTAYGVNNPRWGVSFSSNSYTLQHNGADATTNFPGENSPTHSLPSGVKIASGAGTTVTYNVWGIPVDVSGTIPLTGNVTIIISEQNGASPQTITVTKNTGFIP